MNIQIFQLGLLGTNCYLLEKDGEALVIDPGGDPEIVLNTIEENNLKLQAILLTHAHFDHIGGVESLREETNAPVYIHEEESSWLTDPSLNGSEFFQVGTISTSQPADYSIKPGQHKIGNFSFEAFHTPGHSPGSVSFWFKDDAVIFAGDTLFSQGIGRTDLPFGDHATLIQSITEHILSLPENTTVYPGHGPATQVGEEKRTNSFLI
ncbi:MBL fold metallo-hydrolase [Allobacillus sp. GCM10007491]|uniref:MBL fold metallo-hydrolase n=1 Tax=Allobacillus saliphilus TaxID=2912308 RepID=A0A941CXH3_9BACI|nr:MBL fold metallo-hydrolase [Allobacillus saliphilus]MBR7554208.1 MBL fold metallo-hydrolase [Allobacillus saliphilus]